MTQPVKPFPDTLYHDMPALSATGPSCIVTVAPGQKIDLESLT